MNQSWATDERLTRAAEHYRSCMLCEHRCGADRQAGQRGPCKAGTATRVFRHRVEYSEEASLIPAHLFYVSGCDLRCVFCIAEANAFDPGRGQDLTPDFFQEALAWGRQQGARTLEWVGGEPTIHLPSILQVMAQCPELPPVVWKSDFCFTPEALLLLDGAVEFYLADFKFGNDRCARRLAKVDGYLAIVTRNLKVASRQGKLIVRHLLLPGHFDCCYRPIAEWMQSELPEAEFSLRDGYLPSWQARHYSELAEPLERDHGPRAREFAGRLGLNLIV